jgi:16S rRNA (guanine1207-N2)-methyltransferase
MSVIALCDLWDVPGDYQTVVFPTARGEERELKIDIVEQSYHILRPHGLLVVLSPYDNDQLFPGLLKKVFGKVHVTRVQEGSVFWCHRGGDRPRRRHEVNFHARIGDTPSLRFLSRPGVFSYGQMDEGARALVETMQIEPGDRILDLGCGCGTNGIFAARQSGTGAVTLVDSNVRAVALAEHNARASGVQSFEVIASARAQGVPKAAFDVVLANPPYYAQGSIALFFVERGQEALRPGGRIYVVTKQADQLGPAMADLFGQTEVVERRGYAVLCARRGSEAGFRSRF